MDKDVEKRGPSYTVGGNVNWCSHCGKFLKKLKIELFTIQPRNSTPGFLFLKNENTNLKRYMHPNAHSSIVYNCQDMEVTYMSIDRWMDKEDAAWLKKMWYVCIYTYKMEYYSVIKKNEILPFSTTWTGRILC